ncbi:MAG TPA: hypothetical protein VLS90_12495, partial [Thermodesulfobacteriota bacterium]|nr:hypothetical protein [Thermodesulfobacteriota bacterium]
SRRSTLRPLGRMVSVTRSFNAARESAGERERHNAKERRRIRVGKKKRKSGILVVLTRRV